MTDLHDTTFDCMGCEIRLLLEGPDAHARGAAAQRWLRDFDARLSRFRPDSELSRLNADPRDAVPASRAAPRRRAIRPVGGRADRRARRSHAARRARGGAGTRSTRRDAEPASLHAALAVAPPRRPARPHPAARWRDWTRRRRCRLRAAPARHRASTPAASARGLPPTRSPISPVSCRALRSTARGDVRIGGREAAWRPFQIDVAPPADRRGRPPARPWLGRGGHVRPRRPGVAHARRRLRAPPPRPGHRRARLDRRALRDRARRHRARGRDPGQGGAPLRTRRRPPPSARHRRRARPRRRRRRAGRPVHERRRLRLSRSVRIAA